MREQKIRRLLLCLLLLITSSCMKVYAGESSTSPAYTSGTVPEVLEIDKVIVGATEYNRDAFLTTMTRTTLTPIDATTNSLAFSPVTVKIHTNRTKPIRLDASFKELKHDATSTLIPVADLSVSPVSESFPTPYNGIISNPFTFSTLIRPTTLTGAYTGTISFTVLPTF